MNRISESHAPPRAGRSRRSYARWSRVVAVERGEWPPLFWAFTYFFALLCGYYIVRPMRDEMGIAGGVEHLQWMFSGTFLAMLAVVPFFGWLSRRFAPRQFLPFVYGFFIGNLLLFFVLFKSELTGAWVARAFFIWTSVFNLFIVSVFWSFMADIFNPQQAKRLFGMIAAGGTAGALAGPALTAVLVLPWGPTNLLLLSAVFLGWAVLCVHRLVLWRMTAGIPPEPAGIEATRPTDGRSDKALGGSVLAGIRLIGRSPYLIGICLLMLLFSTLATFLYFQQAQIIRESFDDPSKRTALFAAMDFSVNALTLLTQIFWTGRIVRKIGLDRSLAMIPLVVAAGFLALWLASGLTVIAVVQVARRAGDYAIMRPGREMLYVVLTREEKYKAKNFIDTVVYRAGDALSAWVYAGLRGIGLSAAGICLLAVPLSAVWSWISFRLGRRQEQMAAAEPSPTAADDVKPS